MANLMQPEVPQQTGGFGMGLPQQETTNPLSPVTKFFQDPKNLATGLVFLAALAQGRRPGQSTAGQVGERALGAFAFRGGLDSAERKRKIQDDAIASDKLQRSKENELRGRQVAIGEQGLGIEREKMSQAERLSKEENASRERVALAETESERKLREAQAGLANRTDPNVRAGTGTDKSPMGGETLSKLVEAQWNAELQQAQLEGRAPDPIKMANSISDLVQAWSVMQPGAQLVRAPDGSIARYIPKPGGGGAPQAGEVAPPVEAPRSVFLNPEDVTARPQPKRKITEAERAQNAATHQSAQLSTEAQAFTSAEQINAYINKFGKTLSKEQLRALANRKRDILSKSLSEAEARQPTSGSPRML